MISPQTFKKMILSLIFAVVVPTCVNVYLLGNNKDGLNLHLLLFIGLMTFLFSFTAVLSAPFLQSWFKAQQDRDIFKRNFTLSFIASGITGYLRYTIFSPPQGDNRLENSIIVAFVTFVGVYGLTFFWNLTETLKRFTFTTLAEIYDGSEGLVRHGRISDGLTNAHIASLQYYNIIPNIIINDSNTYCGFVYLRRANFSYYADWVKQLFEYDKIHSYDTMNVFPPDRAIGNKCTNPDAVTRIQALLRGKIPKEAKKKIQVVDIGSPPLSSELTEAKIKTWAIDEYIHEDSKLHDWLNHSQALTKWLDENREIPLYWQFKHTLEGNQYFLGEYVVLNRLKTDSGYSKPEQKTMVIRYDEDEQLMEWLLGNSNTMFCSLFSHLNQLIKHEVGKVPNLTDASPYLDFFRIEDKEFDLFKWQELMRAKLESESRVIEHIRNNPSHHELQPAA